MRDIKVAANIRNVQLKSQARIFELIIAMKAVLPRKNYQRLIKDINTLLKEFKKCFTPINYSALLQDMHFPNNYTDIW